MTFEEIRRLLSTHFSQLLAQQKAQISKDGRLSPIQASALENGQVFAREAVQDGVPLLPSGNDSELVSRFMKQYGLSIQPGTAAYTNLCTELKRAYRDYCSSVLEYDRSLDSYQFERKTDIAPDVQSAAVAATSLSLRELANSYTKDNNLGHQWVYKTQHEKADHISLLCELLDENTDVTTISEPVPEICTGR